MSRHQDADATAMTICRSVSLTLVMGHVVCHVTCCARTLLDGGQTPPTTPDVDTVSVCELSLNAKFYFCVAVVNICVQREYNDVLKKALICNVITIEDE